MSKVLSTMVGGNHYREGAIQPIEFYMANPQLDFCQTNMIKYAFRHKDKNKLEDLLKVVHYAILESKFNYDKEAEFTSMLKDLIGDKK